MTLNNGQWATFSNCNRGKSIHAIKLNLELPRSYLTCLVTVDISDMSSYQWYIWLVLFTENLRTVTRVLNVRMTAMRTQVWSLCARTPRCTWKDPMMMSHPVNRLVLTPPIYESSSEHASTNSSNLWVIKWSG